MLDYSLQGASALLKRSGEGTQPPGNWMSPIFGVIFTLEFFLFLPVFIFVSAAPPFLVFPRPRGQAAPFRSPS